MCIQTVQVNLYTSTEVPNPNSALYDHKLDVKAQSPGTEACDDVYIGEEGDLKRRSVIEKSNTTLFMSLTGIDGYNEFSFNSILGDTTTGKTNYGKVL